MDEIAPAILTIKTSRIGVPEDKVNSFLGSLRLTDPSDDLEAIRRIKGEQVEGSCKWVLGESKYVAWDDERGPGLLWLQGGSGIGKTMILTYLVAQLEQKEKGGSGVTLAYYFCDHKDENRKSTSALLRGLLLQLLRKNPRLFKHVEKDFDEMKGRLLELVRNVDTLWRIFRHILEDRDVGKLYLLVDALDECEKSSQQGFLVHLKKFLTSNQTNREVAIKFLITSRPEPEIEDLLCGVGHSLRIDSAKINTDLASFIDIKVENLPERFPPGLKQRIKTTLSEKAGGTFLWAALVFKDISDAKYPPSMVWAKLDKLPSTLTEVYDEILESIEQDCKDIAMFIFQLVAIARRPLTTRELAMARAIHLNPSAPSKDELEVLRFDYTCCKSLLEHDPGTDTVNLVHQSAKDYLLSREFSRNEDSTVYRIIEDKANLLMFHICWRYLTSTEFNHGRKIIDIFCGRYDKDDKEDTTWLSYRELPGKFIPPFSLLRYAAEEWLEHALAARSALAVDYVFNDATLKES
jgi:hypothetical protein